MSTVTFSVARNDIKNVVDEDGDLSQVAVNVPSFEYNANGTYKGMLVESTSQNEIRNSEGGGSTNGVIGSGGVFPTNWATSVNRLTTEIIGTGTEKGIEYIDIKFDGTPTAGTFHQIAFESNDVISASDAEDWTHSLYLKVVDNTALPDDFEIRIYEWDSTPAFNAFGGQTVTPTTTLARYQLNYTTTDATTAYVQPLLKFGTTVGQAYDFTLRIGLPQLEETSFASSVIETTSAAVERLRDEIKNTSATTYVGQTSGTIYAEVQIDNLKNGYILQASDATDHVNYRIHLNHVNGTTFEYRLTYGSGNQINFSTASSTGNHKLALVYTDGDVRAYLDGSQVGTTNTTSWGDFTSNQLDTIFIGAAHFTTVQFDNWVRAFAFYKRALSDNEAKILTQ